MCRRVLYLSVQYLMIFFISIAAFITQAQQKIGFHMKDGVDRVEIPFEEYSNLIAIPVTINGFVTLKFILDTGAESVILTEKVFGDLLGLNYVRDITIQGPGVIDSLSAYVATNVHMSLPGDIIGNEMNMLVLKEDYLELNKNLGDEIYGIIGYDLFSRFVVQINYEDNLIILHRPYTYKPKNSMEQFPIEIVRGKPYMKSVVSQNGRKDSVKLMVDSGASHALLLDVKSSEVIRIPETLIATRLGQGLGGEIPGFIGRMNGLHVNEFTFEDILVSIPIEGVYLTAIKRGSRHGTIGGDLLTRFNVTFDYHNQYIYLSKSKRFNSGFEHDMSGLTLAMKGSSLDSIVVRHVRRNSPAYEAGLRKGDIIIKMNGYRSGVSTLSQITSLLRRRDGMKIRVRFLRDGEKMKTVFRLKRII